MNPMKQLRGELSEARAKNAKLEKLYVKMSKDYGELITTSIELENKHEAMAEGLARFCGGCSEKDGNLCGGCLLNKWLY